MAATTNEPAKDEAKETNKEFAALAKAYRETGEMKPGYTYTNKTRGGVTDVVVEKIG